MFRAVQPGQQRHTRTGATGDRRRLRAAARQDEWEAQVDSRTCERVQRNDRHAALEVDVWCRDPRRRDQCVERVFSAQRRHGAGDSPASWTTAPSMEIFAAVRYPSSQMAKPLASTVRRCSSVYGLFSMALTRMMAS